MPDPSSIDQLVKDPVVRQLLQHDERIARLEALYQFGVAIAALGVSFLGAILYVLLIRPGG